MKYRFNISALILALVFLVASNGVAVFEHICGTSKTRDFSFFEKIECKMENQVESCCAKKVQPLKNHDCCSNSHFYNKLSVEGFTSSLFTLKKIEKQFTPKAAIVTYFQTTPPIYSHYYSGLAPPKNAYLIASNLQPNLSELQVFLC